MALFTGAVPLAVYAGQWGQAESVLMQFGLSGSIRSATGGSAVSAKTNTSLKSLATG